MGGRFGIWWRITMHQTGRSQKRTNKFFAGTPNGFFKNFFPKRNPKKFAGFRNSINFFKNFFPKRNSTIFFKNFFPKRNSTIFFRPPHKNFVKFGNKLVTKRVAKDIDTTRVKRIELTNKDKIRNRLETQAYFPKQPSFLSTLRRTILDYFLPYPPAPPLKDERNCFWLPPEK